MGIIKSINSAVKKTFHNQWKDVIVPCDFDEHTLVTPGRFKEKAGSDYDTFDEQNLISNGSKIYVPDNTAAFIFSKGGIENIITEAGGYEYQDGEKSIFNKDGIISSLVKASFEKIGFGGISPNEKRICYVNLREIRDINFGTNGPLLFRDKTYDLDFELLAYGSFSMKITDPKLFITNYVPANLSSYTITMNNSAVVKQLQQEFIQSFTTAINKLSGIESVSSLISKQDDITKSMVESKDVVGTWTTRFGFVLTSIAIANIELSDDSKNIIKKYNENRSEWDVIANVSKRTGDIRAQQHIAEGVENHGLGNAAGMIFGMNMAQNIAATSNQNNYDKVDKQLETLNKLKEAYDNGVLTKEEYELKKKEILDL